ncbi:hypothetical protein [Clostridium celatum]|uniref:hypothetical protein n=1 Tax=Clostridium celatum TaxID=36834 RepID=UPI002900C25D|nr:hypothetical protein [Clostridium celatum]MDU2266699.1 hypothetical protein [Clostridium celatum]MDU6297057.1 hypothetical protein [Clostridium celatum]
MSIKVNFMNGTYNQDDFVEEFKAIVGENIIVKRNSFVVSQANPLANKIVVAPGGAFLNGQYIRSDANETLIVENNLTGSTRKDIVVLELQEENNRGILKVVKGTTTAPVVTSTQLLLAEISVKNNSLSIVNADITDKRNVGECAINNVEKLSGYTIDKFSLKSDCEIIEYSNGAQYQLIKKYEDGRMEIYQDFAMLTGVNVPWGNCYVHSDAGTTPENFRIPFINTPRFEVSAGWNNGGASWWVVSKGTGTNTRGPMIQICRSTPYSAIEWHVIIRAVGRWK